MGRAAEMKALIEILEDPTNADKTSEDLAEELIDSLDATRGRTHRIAVVGQISHETPEGGLSEPQTVVLGPYSSRGFLTTPEKFRQSAAGAGTARSDGQQLAWDSKTGTGKGRFMLVPVFHRPRDAWNFYRTEKPGWADNWPHIAESIEQWQPGLWAETTRPVCACGRRDATHESSGGQLFDAAPYVCPIHPGGGARDREEN